MAGSYLAHNLSLDTIRVLILINHNILKACRHLFSNVWNRDKNIPEKDEKVIIIHQSMIPFKHRVMFLDAIDIVYKVDKMRMMVKNKIFQLS